MKLDLSIKDLFEQQVEKSPSAIAVSQGGEAITYLELNQKANQLAFYLLSSGVSPQNIVGVNFDRSIEMIICMLAIIKAGCIYLPIVSGYPQSRIDYMLSNSGVNFLIHGKHKSINTPVTQVCYEDILPILSKQFLTNPEHRIQAEDVAYINYTSGSTGKPKGVMATHKGVLRLFFCTNYSNFSAQDIFLQHSPIGFDAATFEIWGPLLNGGECTLLDTGLSTLAKFRKVIQNKHVTKIFLTTTLFNTIVEQDCSILAGMQQVLTGGESHSVKHMRKAIESLPNVDIVNVYGPTESTTFASFYPVRNIPQNASRIPIGKALSHTKFFILDEKLNPVLPGNPGELFIAGDGLARGYINNSKLTKEKFIKNILALPGNPKVYRTGDLVCELPDGNLDFLGRVDNQVKIRGLRIELDEIEINLSAHEKIEQAIVVVNESTRLGKQLKAFVITRGESLSSQQIKKFLKDRLPEYMLPNLYRLVETFPLTAHNKIDRNKLMQMDKELESC